MKSFSIRELESARKNPAAFAQQLNGEIEIAKSFGGGPAKSMRWLTAACEMHKTDLSKAFTVLENSFSNRQSNRKNRLEVEMYLESLHNYKDEIDKRELVLEKSRENVDIHLGAKLKLTGWIPLIFKNGQGGFSAFFISPENNVWDSELKYPIVQKYIANSVFDVDDSQVSVGYVNFHNGRFNETSYSKKDIANAITELNTLGNTISSTLF